MPEHKIHCPSCAQHLSVPEELAGQRIDCPSCNKPMTLPDFAHAFDEAEEERIEEPRQSPALIVGIVAGVLVFGGLGVFLLIGPDKPADEPEVATLPATQTTLPNPGDERAGSTGQQPGTIPGMELDPNDPFGGTMMPGMMPFGMGFESEEKARKQLEAEIKVINNRLAKGEPIDQYNEQGQTELMVAVEASDIDLAKRLLEKKANPNATTKDNFRHTALHLAAMNENKELLELLIDNGAQVNQTNKAGFTALDSIFPFGEFMPESEGELPELPEAQKATVAYLKSKGGKSMTPEQRANMTPEQIYSMMGIDYEQMVKQLQKIEQWGLGPNDDIEGFSKEVQKAFEMTMPGMMPFGMGMNPNDPFGGGMMPGMMPYGMGFGNDPFGGMDPFGMMGFETEEEIKERLAGEIKTINERLAKGRSLNQYNQLGQTELMVAVEADDIDLARRLLENKAYPNATSKDGQLNTALHLAAIQENKELCELLIDKGVRVNKKNKIGFTALDSVLQFTDPMPGFEVELPEPTEAHRATVAYLKSKGAKSMTPEERATADPFGGMPMPGMGFPGGGPPIVGRVLEGQAASEAGLQKDDKIVSLGGIPIGGQGQLIDELQKNGGKATEITVHRNGEPVTLPITPRMIEGKVMIGVMPGGLGPNPYMLPNAGPYGGGFNPLYGAPKGKKPTESNRQ